MAANQTATASATATSNSLTGTGYVLTSTNGPTYTHVGGGGSGYSNSMLGIGSWSIQPTPASITPGTLELSGDKADIKINGVSLNDTLTAIQKKLDVLTLNPKLEKEWDELKALGEQYRKLEAELAEKSRMWTALKKTE